MNKDLLVIELPEREQGEEPGVWFLTAARGKTPSGPIRDTAPGMAQAQDLARASMSENTRRAYSGVAAYLGDIYEGGLSAALAAMAVAALRFRARLYGRPSPVGPASERVLAGFRRLASERGYGQVDGVRWETADRAAKMAEETGSLAGLRDAAIIAVASDALLRVSEVEGLDVADVNLEEQTVLIRRSKTDQEGEGVMQFIGEPTVARVQAWLEAAGLTEGALFRGVSKGGRPRASRLTNSNIRLIIVRRVRDAGAKGRISGHSLRVGSAQSLATAGASLVEMQLAGRWRSPVMPGRYAQG